MRRLPTLDAGRVRVARPVKLEIRTMVCCRGPHSECPASNCCTVYAGTWVGWMRRVRGVSGRIAARRAAIAGVTSGRQTRPCRGSCLLTLFCWLWRLATGASDRVQTHGRTLRLSPKTNVAALGVPSTSRRAAASAGSQLEFTLILQGFGNCAFRPSFAVTAGAAVASRACLSGQQACARHAAELKHLWQLCPCNQRCSAGIRRRTDVLIGL